MVHLLVSLEQILEAGSHSVKSHKISKLWDLGYCNYLTFKENYKCLSNHGHDHWVVLKKIVYWRFYTRQYWWFSNSISETAQAEVVGLGPSVCTHNSEHLLKVKVWWYWLGSDEACMTIFTLIRNCLLKLFLFLEQLDVNSKSTQTWTMSCGSHCPRIF